MIRGGGLKHVACAEDDDFIQALDKMMLENLQVCATQGLKFLPVIVLNESYFTVLEHMSYWGFSSAWLMFACDCFS